MCGNVTNAQQSGCSKNKLLITVNNDSSQTTSNHFIVQLRMTALAKIDSVSFFECTKGIAADSTLIVAGNNFTLSSLDSGQTTSNYTLEFASDTTHLPYFAQDFQLKVGYWSKGHYDESIEKFHIYFTPYNTIEIWDEFTFYALKRYWFEKQSFSEVNRVFIPKDSIPLSNVSDDTTQFIEVWHDEFNMVMVPGLAYAIPMMRLTAPVLETGDSIDDSRADGCGPGRIRFSYTVSGNIRSMTEANIEAGFSVGTYEPNLPLARLQVKLWENDLLPWTSATVGEDQLLGSTTTDINGNFQISFNTCQVSSLEGNTIEPYLAVYGYSPDYNNRAVSIGHASVTSILGYPQLTFRQIIPLNNLITTGNSSSSLPINLNVVQADNGRLRDITYLHHALTFVNNELSQQIGGNLKVYSIANDGASFFMPANIYYINFFSLPTNAINYNTPFFPAIFLDRNSHGYENLTYHEFGHCVMWQLQGLHWVNPVIGSFSEWSDDEEQNPYICLTEGWADGFSAICDLANFSLDNEARRNGRQFFESNEGTDPVQNGYRHTFSFTCSLFDLYDGPSKCIAQGIPCDSARASHNNEGWQNVNCIEDDNVDLTFQQICKPFLDHNTPVNLVSNVWEYYKYLQEDRPTVQAKNDVRIVFNNNNLREDINRPETSFGIDFFNVDADLNWAWPANGLPIFGPSNSGSLYSLFGYKRDVGTRNGTVQSIEYSPLLHSGNFRLLDDIVFQNGAALRINEYDGDNQAGLADAPTAISTNPSMQLVGNFLYTAENSVYLRFTEGSDLTIGKTVSPTQFSKAHFTLKDNAILFFDRTVGASNELYIASNSQLEVKGGGAVLIDGPTNVTIENDGLLLVNSDAYYYFDPNTAINLLGTNSRLIVDRGATWGTNNANCKSPSIEIASNACDLIVNEGTYYNANCYEIEACCEKNICKLCNYTATVTIPTEIPVQSIAWYNNATNVLLGSQASLTLYGVNTTTVLRCEVTDSYGNVFNATTQVTVDQLCVCRIPAGFKSITPNPNSGSFSFELEVTEAATLTVKLINSSGTTVEVLLENESYIEGSFEIGVNLSNLTAGTYYLSLETATEILSVEPIVIAY